LGGILNGTVGDNSVKVEVGCCKAQMKRVRRISGVFAGIRLSQAETLGFSQ